jgi:peptide deformylase
MAILPIRCYGDPILRRKSARVERIDDEIRVFAGDLIDTMFDAGGVGLAAPQVGRSIRMIAVDATRNDGGHGPRVFINPQILESSGVWEFDEGCLSVPGITAILRRPETIRLRFQDLFGQTREEEFHRLWARALQHETDHLDGKLFVDYLSPMRRTLLMKRLKELARESKSRMSL